MWVSEGQGEVPWHEYAEERLTDALVMRVNLSNGNLMLAATDYDIAGVGRNLQLTRTYNSFLGPYGSTGERWWGNFDRYLDDFFTNTVLVYDETGATLRYDREEDGSLTTPTGYAKDLERNEDGTWTLTDRKTGGKEVFDEDGSLTEVRDRNGGSITVENHHDGDGGWIGLRATETRSDRWVDYTEDASGSWRAEDHTGRTALHTVDRHRRLVTTTDTSGAETRFTYDEDDRVTGVTTPEGRRIAFTYDGWDRVTSVQRMTEGETGPTWTYSYSADSPWEAGSTTVTDPEGDETVYEHDGDGRVTSVTDPLGHTRSRSWDARHNVTTATDAMGTGTSPGNVTTYGWDSRDNLTSIELPTGATAALSEYQTIADADLPGTLTLPDGQTTDYSYDTRGNTVSVTVAGEGGGTRTFTHNSADPECGGFQGQRCTATDANGNTTSFTYDDRGDLTRAEPPAPMGATRYRYDDLGRPEAVTDGRGITVHYTYDDRDRVITVDTASYAEVEYSYDGDGNLISRTDPTGTTEYIHDALGRETLRTLADGSTTVLTHTADGHVASHTDAGGTVEYDYDAAGRLTELTDPAGRTTTFTYDRNDRRTETVLPGGTEHTITRDASGRPTRITAISDADTLLDLEYSYTRAVDGVDEDGTKIRALTDHAADTHTVYTYDAAGRLTEAVEETSAGTQSAAWRYCFDPAGNLTARAEEEDTCEEGATYGYNAASQLVTVNGEENGWAYDRAGNEMDALSTLPRSDAGYSEHGQLSRLTAGGTTWSLAHADTTQEERTRLGDTRFRNGPLGVTEQYDYAQEARIGFIREPEGTLHSMTTDGDRYHYYLTDATGSVLAMVDDTGEPTHTYAYTPTGELRDTAEEVGQPYQFAGAHHDPTGLYKMGARYYDPHLGRFTQPDPSGQEPNPYLYALGDPVNHTDPTGLWTMTDTVAVTFAVAGLITAVPTGGASLTVGTAIGLTVAQTGVAFAVGCGISGNC
ncbi:RHS repeat-associated core domain-containing protein [Streptomyces calidiresistens]